MTLKIIIFLFISTILISGKVNQNLTGKYSSDFALIGFFIAEFELKPDKSIHNEF
jgi:hypothetical protein